MWGTASRGVGHVRLLAGALVMKAEEGTVNISQHGEVNCAIGIG